ncbi:MAG: AI-2E family transporter [Coprococcus sp.]
MNMILTGLSDSMINMAGIFMDLFIGLVVAIYLLYGRRKFKKQGKLLLYSLFKARWADKIIEEIRFADRVFSGFIGGKLLDSAIIGGICYIGMMIMGLPYAILISVIVGVTNIIPFFGPYIGAIPSAIILLTVSPDVLSDVCYFYCDFAAGGRQYHRAERFLEQYGIIRYLGTFSHSAFSAAYSSLVVGMIIGVPVFAVIYDLIRQLIIRGLELRSKSKMFDDYQHGNIRAKNKSKILGVIKVLKNWKVPGDWRCSGPADLRACFIVDAGAGTLVTIANVIGILVIIIGAFFLIGYFREGTGSGQ